MVVFVVVIQIHHTETHTQTHTHTEQNLIIFFCVLFNETKKKIAEIGKEQRKNE